MANDFIPQKSPNTAQNPAAKSAQGSAADDSGFIAQTAETPFSDAPDTGEVTNDVGNTVIVPKEGESFSDTMQRAVVQGRKTTPAMLNAEERTMPAKVAQTVAAAPLIGAGGVLVNDALGTMASGAEAAKDYLFGNTAEEGATDAAGNAIKGSSRVAQLARKGVELANSPTGKAVIKAVGYGTPASLLGFAAWKKLMGGE
jgi:hypothetical protein